MLNKISLLAVVAWLASGLNHCLAAESPGAVFANIPKAQPAPPLEAPEDSTRQAPKVQDNSQSAGPKIHVRGFRFVGNSLFSTEQLFVLTRHYRNKKLTLNQLYYLADQLSLIYRQRGYRLASVTLPVQKVSDGLITLEVIEGRIETISGQGNSSYDDDFLAYGTGGLLPEQLYRHQAMERKTLLLNDQPGLDVRAVIEPGQQYGHSRIVFNVKETRLDGLLALDNAGRESVGQWRQHAKLNWNNPTHSGDRLGASVSVSEGGLLRYGLLDYERLLSSRGTRLNASYTDARYRIEDPAFPLDIQGRFQEAQLGVNHPLVRQRLQNWFVGAVLSYTRTSSTNVTGSTVQGDRLPLLHLKQSYYQAYGRWGAMQLGGSLSSNFKRRQAASLTGAADNGQRLKVTIDYGYLLPLAQHWQLYWRGNVAWSPDELADSQKYSLGGPYSVRSYQASDWRGDQGALSSLELRYLLALGPATITTKAFTDIGYAKATQATGRQRSETLSSAGIGMDMSLYKNWKLNADLAFKLSDFEGSDDSQKRLWVTLGYQF